MDIEVMRGEELSRAIHAGLHFIEDKHGTCLFADGFGVLQIRWSGDADARFTLNGLHDEGRELPRGQMLFKGIGIAKRDCLRLRQQRAEAVLPESISHEGKGATGKPVEGSFRI